MRNYEVIFDRDRHRVAFYPSDCGGMHALRHSSVLQARRAPSSAPSPLPHPPHPAHPSTPPQPACHRAATR